MISTDLIQVKLLNNGILQLNLNRPKQLNALNHATLLTLCEILTSAKQDKNVRAILLTGEGKAFCAGADINQLQDLTGMEGIEFARFGQRVFRLLELLGKPSLAAIHGYSFGGGCELAMAATFRIAAVGTAFGLPEIKLGILPGFAGTQRIARLIGKGRALELCLTGRRFNTDEALSWGFISEIVEPDQLFERAKERLLALTELSPSALSSIMTVIHHGYDLAFEEGCELEAAHFGICCSTTDKTEGVNAFLEKRKPVFSGG